MKKIIFTAATLAVLTTVNPVSAEMKHYKNAQSMDIASLNIEGVNAFLQDVTKSNNPKAPLTCGMFRMEQGRPLVYTYSYDESKVMLEGEMTLSDTNGKTVDLKPGDVVSFHSGDTITFSTKSSGLAFYCGQR